MSSKCVDPNAPIKNCLNCGKSIHTCEREVAVNNSYLCPIHKEGFETHTGDWFCSEICCEEYQK